MIVSDSTVQLQSRHLKTTVSQETETFRAWIDGATASDTQPEKPTDSASFQRIVDRVKLSAESLELAHGNAAVKQMRGSNLPEPRALMNRLKNCSRGNCNDSTVVNDADDAVVADSQLNLMKQLVEMLSGRKVRVFDPSALNADTEGLPDGDNRTDNVDARPARQSASNPADGVDREGWGVSYDYRKTTVSAEQTRFQAEGVVRTRDGREIQFSSLLQMESERIEVESFQLRAGDAQLTDPLVLNFDGNAAELTDGKIGFDLNGDGRDESISFVANGSGFLVYDRNRDGIVNNGTELFGPATGNGFAELATHDDDGNGWIDEGDAVYNDLRIWQGNAATPSLTDLRSANVGAIYLGSALTPFENRSTEGTLLGQVTASGVFLFESGQVGTVQQVDLVS